MARLKLFGRSLEYIASDDLLIPMVSSSLLSLIWLSVYVVLLLASLFACPVILVYLSLAIVVLIVTLFTETTIAIISLSGTIADESPRFRIKFWIHLYLTLKIVETGIQAFGAYKLFKELDETCKVSNEKLMTLRVFVVLHLAYLTFALIFISVLFMRSTVHDVSKEQLHDIWQKRVHFLCLGHRKSNQNPEGYADDTNALSNVARMFANFFHDHDLAPSDIFVGLLLTRREQLKVRKSILNTSGTLPPSTAPSRSLSFADIPTNIREQRHAKYSEIDEVLYYFDYAEAIYGLPLYLLNRWKGGLKACCFRSSSAQRTAQKLDRIREHYTSPGWPFCFLPKKSTNLIYDENLIYISLNNELFRPPFFVWLDHNAKSIVVAIRGTLSFADLLVDMDADITELIIPGFGNLPPQSVLTHNGIYKAALNLKRELDQYDVLSSVYNSGPYMSYKIVCTGHSLGAGVAALLTHLLRTSTYKNSICYAFSPPGCIVSKEGQPYFETFCVSAVFGTDLIPRLSRRSAEKLNLQIHQVLSKCEYPKARVLAGLVGRLVSKGSNSGTPRFVPSCLVPSWFVKLTEEEYTGDDEGGLSRAFSSEGLTAASSDASIPLEDLNNSTTSRSPEQFPRMYLPGKILHFIKERENIPNDTGSDAASDQSWFGRRSRRTPGPSTRHIYKPVWATCEDFEEIIVSATMLSDHMPNNTKAVIDNLKEIAKDVVDLDQLVQGASC